ncbi:hypothetical protein JTZ10_10950 [Gordonia rubripertincta]|uniref:Uncharacterized protein n=1 Tax=Gordonia rubripertincta TaxID=36822 RepID=A0AAW4G5D9_GORRU|nr:hypothetical protein [Gordonia rubripertincta]MBM7278280.1 hypothetical protein [Gordonia rubripertincta]
MTTSDFWESRPVLTHVRDFARARRVPPLAMLASLTARAIGSLDPNVVGPPVVGAHSSLNAAFALVGPSGFGKGVTEAAARDATNLPQIPELPLGSGEGLARTFAVDDEGQQEIRAAMFTASEVDGLAAIGARQGATVMSVFRQAISGESIGSANAQKHTRVIVPAHGYRAVFTIGVQPERAGPLINDTAGTAQRILWVPTTDPDAPAARPSEPPRWTVPRTLVPADRRTVLELPHEAVEAMDQTQLGKLHGDPDIDPLDGHALMTRAKIAAGLMVLDGRMYEVSTEDWQLAGVLMRESDRTRERIVAALSEAARRSNRAKAHAVAERDDVVAEKRVSRAANGIVTRLQRAGRVLSHSELRKALRSDLRPEFQPAIDSLLATGAIKSTPHGYALEGGQVDTPVHPQIRRSEGVDTLSTWTPDDARPPAKTLPGDTTDTTPGLTSRVLEIIGKAQA